ncbi:MAG: SDR family oxidoreductase [Solirubrobacteraceae bacterium]
MGVLVIGGRSKIGSALIDELLAREVDVRALVRGSEAAERFPAGVEMVVGDLADQPSLSVAMDGVEQVFLLSSAHRDAVAWHENAIRAAKQAGVALLVRSSILGAGHRSEAVFVDAHARIDRYLKESRVPYVILRPNLFLQNVPESNIPAIGPDGNMYVNAGEARISMVDTRDVAAVAAVVLTDPGHAGQIYDVTGPEALSYADVAAALTRSLGREVEYVDVQDDAVREALAGYGLDPWFVEALIGLYEDYRRSGPDGYAAQVTDTVQWLTGRAPRTLAGLLAELRPAAA